jgi:hypothetical protein
MLNDPISFYRWMLITPLPILAIASYSIEGYAGSIADAGLIFGGTGYLIWALLTLVISLNKSWKTLKIWLLLGPFSFWLINLPVLYIATGFEGGSILLWWFGARYAIPVACGFIGCWFAIRYLLLEVTRIKPREI